MRKLTKCDIQEKDYSLAVALVCVGILLVLCALVAAGCQTMAGMCRDVEAAARYGHEHMNVDE